MAWQLAGEASGGKGRCVGSLWVTIGPLRLTIGHQGVTIGHLRVTIGYLKATVVHIKVTLGHLRVTIGYFFSISKHKANTTELHPKVSQTCICWIICTETGIQDLAKADRFGWWNLFNSLCVVLIFTLSEVLFHKNLPFLTAAVTRAAAVNTLWMI